MTAICEFLNEFESDEEDAARKDEPSTSGSTPSAAAADEFTVFDVDALQQRFKVDGLSVWEDACSEAYAEAVREEVTLLQEAMMMEPTETESKETLDAFADALHAIAAEDPEVLQQAPHSTSVSRPDEVAAGRHPCLSWSACNE